ncbi:MAG: T9SS type A sorting domain-containing protein [Sphingobacteriales bacterium]|nr:MAG: T9SS type A sorting domain-containing protein [Sphingobacteriales bacterium]
MVRRYCFGLTLFVLFLASTIPLYAQEWKYRADNSVKVYANDKPQTMAWCGGVNTPQFALADLNRDGKNDLVIFEQSVGVRTFINTGTAANAIYTYASLYEQYFPVVNEYLKLVDYNKDNVTDLIHRGRTGFSVYKGYYGADNRLRFSFYKDLYYTTPNGGTINVYCEPNDIPSVEDVDGDGDLDFFSYSIGGGYVSFYKNCRVEHGLPADSIKICLSDNCWGKVYQGYERTQSLGTGCSNFGTSSCKGCELSGNKTTHTGNTLCLLDYDSDSDFDFFNGNNAFPDIQLLTNGKREHGYSIDTMITQDTLWDAGGVQLSNMLWPAAFWLDVDGDGDKDLLFSPHGSGTENYRCITYYKNTGTASAPSYTYQSDTFLIDQMIDAGTGSYPMLYDYNRDGKPDLFIGSQGYHQTNGTFRSRLSYCENTSTEADVSFTLRTKDFLNISSLSITGAIPTIGDLSRDGKDDLLIGKLDGTILLYRNYAASANDIPDWRLEAGNLKDNTGAEINVGGFAAPFIYDIDKDGQNDLIIGNRFGTLVYYKNVSTVAGQLALEYKTDTLGGARSAPPFSAYGYSVPFIGKLDDSGKEYLLLGSQSGALYRYDGFQDGNVSGTYTRLDEEYKGIKIPSMSSPAVADLDGDGNYEIISGNVAGGLKLFKLSQMEEEIGETPITDDVIVFPNPANRRVTIAWGKSFNTSSHVDVILFNSMGQKVAQDTISLPSVLSANLDVGYLSSGVYYCVVLSGKNRRSIPVVVNRL